MPLHDMGSVRLDGYLEHLTSEQNREPQGYWSFTHGLRSYPAKTFSMMPLQLHIPLYFPTIWIKNKR